MYGFPGSAAILPDDLDRSISHFFTQGIVPGNLQKSFCETLCIGYHAAGARSA